VCARERERERERKGGKRERGESVECLSVHKRKGIGERRR